MRPPPAAFTAPPSISATSSAGNPSPRLEEESYRAPMRIEAVRAYRWDNRFVSFPVCPRCDSTMEREYQAFCDRCGQRLSWRGFRRAAVLIAPCEKRELF